MVKQGLSYEDKHTILELVDFMNSIEKKDTEDASVRKSLIIFKDVLEWIKKLPKQLKTLKYDESSIDVQLTNKSGYTFKYLLIPFQIGDVVTKIELINFKPNEKREFVLKSDLGIEVVEKAKNLGERIAISVKPEEITICLDLM